MKRRRSLCGAVPRNISQRVQMLDTLRKLRHAVEQAPNSIFIAGADGNIEYVNPAFTATTGYSPEEVIGRNPRLLSAGRHTRGCVCRPVGPFDLWPSVAR